MENRHVRGKNMGGKWIWVKKQKSFENQRACFGVLFKIKDVEEEITLKISASTRYIAYLNGKEIGTGPMRSGRDQWFYDTYSLNGLVQKGENYLAVHVWSYGWSTYQSISAPGGLIFEVVQNRKILVQSDKETRGILDKGHICFAPKRNVNLGFTDYYDSRKFNSCWMEKPKILEDWEKAAEISNIWGELKERPILPFTEDIRYPQHIVGIQQVKKGCQQISVNTRKAFFPERKDANETIFSGFLGFIFVSRKKMTGSISFPNRLWNGLLGNLFVDGVKYEVTNEKRYAQIDISSGQHLFLMEISGKYDDLYCHMEMSFPEDIQILEQIPGIFVLGPTQQIEPIIDGVHRVYGGLKEFNHMEYETDFHQAILKSENFQELKEAIKKYKISFKQIETKDIYMDSYLLSLARTEKVVVNESVDEMTRGILWKNDRDCILSIPDKGDYKRIILDFGDIYIGNFEFLLKASAGTIIDVYIFENMYQGDIDYTIGLNNGFRYIAKDGWQKYHCMARIGGRYAMITVRNTEAEMRIRDFHISSKSYASSRSGEFSCDVSRLNEIWNMCCRTHELCMEDSFTDCPTYEQAFWIGDAQLSAKINGYVYGDYDFIRHNLILAATAAENTGLMNALTPTDWNTSIPMWTMNWIVSIKEYVETSGDIYIIHELYNQVKDTLKYYEQFITCEGGILIEAWNMLDWADLDIHNYGVVTGQQAVLAYCYGIGAEFALKENSEKDRKEFLELKHRLLKYIDEKMWDEEKLAYRDGWSPEYGFSETFSIQSHVLLYLYDGITDEKKRKITEGYFQKLPDYFIKAGSPFMLSYLYSCMIKNGQTEEVFHDICIRWGEMIHYDSTTCWEVFPGFYENSRTRSYCHSWSAFPAVLCLEQMLGVKRIERGWKKIKIEVPEKMGNWCRGAVPTPFGVIRAWWEREEKTYRLQLPEGIEIDGKDLNGWKLEVERTAVRG